MRSLQTYPILKCSAATPMHTSMQCMAQTILCPSLLLVAEWKWPISPQGTIAVPFRHRGILALKKQWINLTISQIFGISTVADIWEYPESLACPGPPPGTPGLCPESADAVRGLHCYKKGYMHGSRDA
jgi:hypothetical protein